MPVVNNPLVLVSFDGGDAPDRDGWLAHHLTLGFDRIILYQPPEQAKSPQALPAVDAAQRLERRDLQIDVGPPLKSAMVSAMTDGTLPDGAWAMALELDAFLTPKIESAALACAVQKLPDGCAAWCLTLCEEADSASPRTRALFRADRFLSHDGTRPIRAVPGDAPLWCDAAGHCIDPEKVFWGTDARAAADGAAWEIRRQGPSTEQVPAVPAAAPPPARDEEMGAPGGGDERAEAQPDLAPQARPGWAEEIGPDGRISGFYRRLEHQSLVHIHRDPDRLVVTFDNLSAVGDNAPDRVPWGYKFLREAGVAHLGVLAHRKDWYREPGLISALEALRDDGFFARYRDVIFTGTSMGGFAALAFSSLAPGARVLAFSPQTTLDEAIVPWETRFGMGRIRNWRLPFSDAAFEVEEAAEAIIISDPYFELDQRHVERLKTPNIRHLKAWYSGHFSPVFLRRAELLKPVMSRMIDGTLTEEAFYRLYRARKRLPWYKRSLQEALEARGRKALASRVGPAFHRVRREMATQSRGSG